MCGNKVSVINTDNNSNNKKARAVNPVTHLSTKTNTDAARCFLVAHQISHVFHHTSMQPLSAAAPEYYKKQEYL